jgi:hypothetical protein
MSAYQEARLRLSQALAGQQAAWQDPGKDGERLKAAITELGNAAGEVRRFEVDPEYSPKHRTAVAA